MKKKTKKQKTSMTLWLVYDLMVEMVNYNYKHPLL